MQVTDENGAVSTASATVEVTEAPDEPPLFIDDIRFESKCWGTRWRAVVEVRSAVDDTPVAGVTLKFDFAGRTYTLTTDSNGVARTNWNRAHRGNYYADAYDLALAGYNWDPFGHDNEDDSDGDGRPDGVLRL
ncbi:MAG: hypothetical protein KDA92_13560 [Planctomycetales bacterium]|nr:hypothetical protein [Planctomycetales bacterium]